MAERGSRKIPVTERQFLWVQDDDKGEVILHVGPTMVSPTAADRVVVDDGDGGFREDNSGQPQRMVELSDAQYAVLYNPLQEQGDGEHNGKFRPGRNESQRVRNGTRNMIPGPCSFYLRPGQRVEVRDAHELASNQYLVVKVYGDVDAKAPYYGITARSATITMATAEDVLGSGAGLDAVSPVQLTRGQLIVIRGLDTQFYIPPTGVDVVPDLSIDSQGTMLTAATARKILASVPKPEPAVGYGAPPGFGPPPMPQQAFGPPPAPANFGYAEGAALDAAVALQEEEQDDAPKGKRELGRRAYVEQAARMRNQVQRQAPAMEPPPPEEKLSPGEVQQLLQSDVHRQALEREVRKSRLVRQAVVLSEKEFCVILDADGKRQIKRGPARVFPGPYDSFMTKGSKDRIYYAYELLPQRALWLRFIAPIAKKALEQLLPRGVPLEQETYHAGDELIVTGVNSFFFPFNEIEILHPLTGRPHVGNDHSDIFIEAIGIDQRSGIYVRDLSTGEARLVRGKLSYLVDPRNEVHITRTIPEESWNLWIGASEPHKVTGEPVVTPWALSITVPHNTAVLATSAAGQRVIEGPCAELLHYEETLAPLALSTSTPKSDENPLVTCFLRTEGNRVSDVIRVETADFVTLNVAVSYQVTFDREHRDRWFSHNNYIGLLCDRLRSLVRGRARQLPLVELWPNLPNVVRDLILGERTEAGRKGRLFPENGMRVTEVEVLASDILDTEIAQLLETVQRESVSLVIHDRQAAEQLRSKKLRHEFEREGFDMERETRERHARLDDLVRTIEHDARLAAIKGGEIERRTAAELEAARQELVQAAGLKRDEREGEAQIAALKARTNAQLELDEKVHKEQQGHRQALTAIETAQLEAASRCTVAERQAVQPALVEALTGLGDKILLGEVAANMNLVSLFKGRDVASIFSDVLGGTKVGRTIAQMMPPEGNGANDTTRDED